MLFHGGGKPPPKRKKKKGIEKLALTNNMAAAGIRTLLAVLADGTLSNDPSPSQLSYIYIIRPPPLHTLYTGNAKKKKKKKRK